MSKLFCPAKAAKVLLALCLVLCLSFAFLSVNAFASGVIIVGGGDDSDDDSGAVVVPGNGGGSSSNDDVVIYGENVVVTKSPTGEVVAKGEAASFVARAENATDRIWRLVSPDASNTIPAVDGPDHFRGLWVDGVNTDTLTLGNIPESLNGWYVECKFLGTGGPVFTSGAKIVVTGATTTTNDPTNANATTNTATGNTNQANNTIGTGAPGLPTIKSQPQGTNLQKGQVTSLSVSATGTEGAELNYQWYSNAVNSTTGGTPIAGAINAQYQPPEKEGSMFYYVAVWETLNNQTGTKVFSNPVEIKYFNTGNAGAAAGTVGGNTGAAGTPGTTGGLIIDGGPTAGNNNSGAPAGAVEPTTPIGSSQPAADNTANSESESSGGSTAVVMLVIALVALVACLGLVVKSGLLPKR